MITKDVRAQEQDSMELERSSKLKVRAENTATCQQHKPKYSLLDHQLSNLCWYKEQFVVTEILRIWHQRLLFQIFLIQIRHSDVRNRNISVISRNLHKKNSYGHKH